MNNEIKEILEIFKQVDLEQEVGGCYNCPKKGKDKTCIGCLNNAKDKLLDYITNLQQAVKNTKETADDMLYELNEENDRLKLELSGYREAILRDDTLLGLQERIDKAIEYIENDTFKCKNQEEQLNYDYDLLDILRGKDNE